MKPRHAVALTLGALVVLWNISTAQAGPALNKQERITKAACCAGLWLQLMEMETPGMLVEETESLYCKQECTERQRELIYQVIGHMNDPDLKARSQKTCDELFPGWSKQGME